ncbi:MAG: two-component system, chemotaxis family, sensor kinase CheA [Frankiaceae bacterium]|nr:two-component system, chemotaxis family, sensor kinase CheA [Frankiaceae bacterium]
MYSDSDGSHVRGGGTTASDTPNGIKATPFRADHTSVASWTIEDPDLIATFRAEVEERLASLQAGLLQLEGNPSPKQVIAKLFRDAHTVKGSARMLGLGGVLDVAHHCEDLLGALRDGRFGVRKDVVTLLLSACDAISRAIPGASPQLTDEDLAPVVVALKRVLAGEEGVEPPVIAAPVSDTADDDEPRTRDPRLVDSMRIAADKVYELLDVVGEAELGARRVEQTSAGLLTVVAEQQRWAKVLRDSVDGGELPMTVEMAVHRMVSLTDSLQRQLRGMRELSEGHRSHVAKVRDGAMGLAMVPVRRVFAALPRIARDVATATGKEVRIEMTGEDVELDKQVLDGIADALKHLIINAVDHGCESPSDRRHAGKPAQAVVRVSARSAGGTVVVEVSDDGRGIDENSVRRKAIDVGLIPADSTLSGPALLQLLFLPAFSTNNEVTETSGRGVGLDVVQEAAEELGGHVAVTTRPGLGSTFALTLPVTLGVLRCLVARVADELYAIPVPSVVESVSLKDMEIHMVAGSPVILRHGQHVPLLDLGAALGVGGERVPRAALVARHGDRQLAWAVDRLESELELVVKDLGPFLGRLQLVTGATIDSDGSVVCLLDLRELGDQITGVAGHLPAPVHVPSQRDLQGGQRKARILLAEDSLGVRELERVILEGAGYQVETCVDGMAAASKLGSEVADLVLTDVEMPGMDGFTLTRTVRRTKGWENVPVVIMTSCQTDEDQRKGLEAGASAYLFKQEFDQTSLVETVRRLIGR